jgi:hypothetical protein
MYLIFWWLVDVSKYKKLSFEIGRCNSYTRFLIGRFPLYVLLSLYPVSPEKVLRDFLTGLVKGLEFEGVCKHIASSISCP